MKNLYSLILAALASPALAQTTHNLVTGPDSFNPPLLTVQPGDIINITVVSGHTCTEVAQATWNANGSTSNGGFDYGAGTHQLVLNTPGTYYYVCQIHVFMGMKGRIIVESGTGIGENTVDGGFLVLPNPASDELAVTLTGTGGVEVVLTDAQGREALRRPAHDGGRIGIGHLSEGNYVVTLLDGQGTTLATRRLTIAR